ncbi:MAG: hypothetical protein QGG42_15145 [Phycisphaerae bacterium]|jgi:hypothetical protein|nr:hypothetical protein [Phycisphaerae bacterium]
MKSSLLIVALLLPAAVVCGRDVSATPENYRTLLGKLEPGDTLRLAPGRFARGLRIRGMHGKAGKPITIQGSGAKTVMVARNGSNTADLTDASWIVIRNLTFDGRNLQNIDAIKAGGDTSKGVHHITIEGNTIVNHGANQQTVAISTKVPCWDWVIRGNTIIGAGTGLYLGNSDGRQPFIRGIIEGNFVKDPQGYCMQIKHQHERPETPGIPAKACTTIIRYNVFIKNDRRGSSGDRPNLLVGGFPKTGPGAKDRYQIYGNLLVHNPRESLFQGTGSISLHDNIFVDTPRTAISIMPHNRQAPRSIRIYHNTFFRTARPVRISGLPKGAERLVAGNLLLAPSGKAPADWTGNAALIGPAMTAGIAAPVLTFGKMDLQPRRLNQSVALKTLRRRIANDTDFDLDYLKRKKPQFDHHGAMAAPHRKPQPIRLELRKNTITVN